MKQTTIEAVTELVKLVGGTTWTRTSHCYMGNWCRLTDYCLLIDGKYEIFVSTGMDDFEKQILKFIRVVHTFRARKEYYLQKLREQAEWDNAVAKAEGLHPVQVLDVGILSPECKDKDAFFQPYVLLEVAGRQFKFSEYVFAYNITENQLDRWLERSRQIAVFTPSVVKTPDYIFCGVRFDSRNGMFCIR